MSKCEFPREHVFEPLLPYQESESCFSRVRKRNIGRPPSTVGIVAGAAQWRRTQRQRIGKQAEFGWYI